MVTKDTGELPTLHTSGPEQRGFPIGTELEDWLEAERAIDATLVEHQGEVFSAAQRGGPNGVGKESIAAPST